MTKEIYSIASNGSLASHDGIAVNGISPPPTVVRLSDLKLKSAAIFAANFLSEGHVIAIPTDTVYGVAGLVQDKGAVQKLYKIKGKRCDGNSKKQNCD